MTEVPAKFTTILNVLSMAIDDHASARRRIAELGGGDNDCLSGLVAELHALRQAIRDGADAIKIMR